MLAAPRILFVEDEVSIQRAVAPLLKSRGYDVEIAASGIDALRAFRAGRPDLIVLDLGLPDIDGTEVCRTVRAQSDVPIVVLTARTGETDKVSILDAGADDCVTKPFLSDELLARIRVALRRVLSKDAAQAGTAECGSLTIDYDRHRVLRRGREIRLTPKEFDLLSLLAHHRDRVLTHRALLTAIWGPKAIDHPEHLWVLVSQLRRKIEVDPSNPELIVSEPWVGYRLVTS